MNHSMKSFSLLKHGVFKQQYWYCWFCNSVISRGSKLSRTPSKGEDIEYRLHTQHCSSQNNTASSQTTTTHIDSYSGYFQQDITIRSLNAVIFGRPRKAPTT